MAQIEARKGLLDAYGIGVDDLFVRRDGDEAYVDFLPEGAARRPDAARLAELAASREAELRAAFDEWWAAESEAIADLAPPDDGEDDRTESERKKQLALLRADLIETFTGRLGKVGPWTGTRSRVRSPGGGTRPSTS